jgi:hypothetical protein
MASATTGRLASARSMPNITMAIRLPANGSGCERPEWSRRGLYPSLSATARTLAGHSALTCGCPRSARLTVPG